MASPISPSSTENGVVILLCLSLLLISFTGNSDYSATLSRLSPSFVRVAKSSNETSVPFQLPLPHTLKSIYIDVGPNLSPLVPPEDDTTAGVLAVEPNTDIAHYLRETYQKKRYPFRFFVINCALGGEGYKGGITAFQYNNTEKKSSDLAHGVEKVEKRGLRYASGGLNMSGDGHGSGPTGMDFVAVLGLEELVRAIPDGVRIRLLQLNGDGLELDIVKGVRKKYLHRVDRIKSREHWKGNETIRYEGDSKDLGRDWDLYMKSVGYTKVNGTEKGFERSGEWVRKE